MVSHDPPPPLWSVGEVLGIGRLSDDLVAELSAGFQFTKEYGGTLSTEKRSGRGVHSFLFHLASGVATVSGFKRVII